MGFSTFNINESDGLVFDNESRGYFEDSVTTGEIIIDGEPCGPGDHAGCKAN